MLSGGLAKRTFLYMRRENEEIPSLSTNPLRFHPSYSSSVGIGCIKYAATAQLSQDYFVFGSVP